ncbi:MAG: GNAT family N-acetyltransferase [Lachnospiraceae bacterium]|nr:GNAT family N-acetyltransferase [Lachnospiraceae bacterium]
MIKLTDYGKIDHLLDRIKIEKVYPLSVLEGIQKGEIFVDNDETPAAALIWHYCGFANILGAYDESFIEKTMKMMQDPPEGHSGRMALQAENDRRLEDMILKTPIAAGYERYIFEFAGEKFSIPQTQETELKEITAENYGLMKGKIIPAFSWPDKEEFLKNGFGYCLIKDGHMLACAFASGISKDYVDIGVETAEECRGKGYGKIVSAKMAKEILRRGQTPVWDCDTRNEASMRLACSIGFKIVGTHPWYTSKF